MEIASDEYVLIILVFYSKKIQKTSDFSEESLHNDDVRYVLTVLCVYGHNT
jgi:hypothetical protein